MKEDFTTWSSCSSTSGPIDMAKVLKNMMKIVDCIRNILANIFSKTLSVRTFNT